MLQIEFLTDPEVVRRVLPPTFEPAETPFCSAMVGRWHSNCVGDFTGGALYVAARYGDIDGAYVAAMFMDGDQPIIFGRDIFGEPKKQAETRLHRRGKHMVGHVERHGVKLIEITADLTTDLGPTSVDGNNFNIKASPASNGVGLESDAIVTVAVFSNELWENHEGTGSLTLRGTAHDPLDEFPVVEVLRSTYIEGDLSATCRSAGTIPAADFVPYAYGRMDDWSMLNTEALVTV
jgi:acetoacetate decarboxylase